MSNQETQETCKPDQIRVLVVDDHPLIRQGLIKVLELDVRIQIAGEAGDGREAIEKIQELEPDVVLLDINMPLMNGIEATRAIHSIQPKTKILILTMHDDDAYVIESVRSGAAGYLLKDVEPHNLIDAIRTVCKGGTYIHPRIAVKLMGEGVRLANKNNGENAPRRDRILTRREVEVMRCLARGQSNRDIANELFISEKTVKNHISNIFHKLDVTDRTQALIKGLKLNIVNLD